MPSLEQEQFIIHTKRGFFLLNIATEFQLFTFVFNYYCYYNKVKEKTTTKQLKYMFFEVNFQYFRYSLLFAKSSLQYVRVKSQGLRPV